MSRAIEFLYPESEQYWDNNFKNVKFLSGAGAAGCVFTGEWKKERRVLKVLFAHAKSKDTVYKNPETQEDIVLKLFDDAYVNAAVMREASIGGLLSGLPSSISEMFATTHAVVIAKDIPASWVEKMTEDKGASCRVRHRDAVKAYVIIQDFIQGQDLDAFLSKQKQPLSGEAIRAFIFQMVIALGVAQYEIGFLHNDLKLENVLAKPVKEAMSKQYVINGDVFTLRIPADGFEIGIIDFGASVLVTSKNSKEWPLFRAPTNIYTPGYEPFDMTLILEERTNDADMTALFVMAVNMLSHRRKAIPEKYGYAEDDRFYEYEPGLGFFYEYDTMYNDAVAETLAETLYSKKDIDEDIIAETKHFGLYILMGRALGIDFEQGKTYHKSIKKAEKQVYQNITDPNSDFTLALNKVKNEEGGKLTDYFSMVPSIVRDAFEDESVYASSFLKLLFQPWAANRLAFGVKDFSTFGFSNALYHPFLAGYMWNIETAPSQGIESIQLLQPLVYLKDLAQITKTFASFEESMLKSMQKEPTARVVDLDKTPPATPSFEQSEWPVLPEEFYVDLNKSGSTNATKAAYMMGLIKECFQVYFPDAANPPAVLEKDVLQQLLDKYLGPLGKVAPTIVNNSKKSALILENLEKVVSKKKDGKFAGSFVVGFDSADKKKEIVPTGGQTPNTTKKPSDNFEDTEDIFVSVATELAHYYAVAYMLPESDTDSNLQNMFQRVKQFIAIVDDGQYEGKLLEFFQATNVAAKQYLFQKDDPPAQDFSPKKASLPPPKDVPPAQDLRPKEDVSLPPPVNPVPLSPKKSASFYSEQNNLPKTKGDVGTYMINIIQEIVDMYYASAPTVNREMLLQLVEKQLVPLYNASHKLQSDGDRKMIMDRFEVLDDNKNILLLAGFQQGKTVISGTPSEAKGYGVEIGVVGNLDDAEDVFLLVTKYLFIYFAIAQKLKSAKVGVLDAASAEVAQMYNDFPEGDLESLARLTREKIAALIAHPEAKINMQIIGDALFEFHNETEHFEWKVIKDDLIVPIYQEMKGIPELEPVRVHLDTLLNATPVESMTQPQQVHLLRMLGSVAHMIYDGAFPPAKISTCLGNQVINI